MLTVTRSSLNSGLKTRRTRRTKFEHPKFLQHYVFVNFCSMILASVCRNLSLIKRSRNSVSTPSSVQSQPQNYCIYAIDAVLSRETKPSTSPDRDRLFAAAGKIKIDYQPAGTLFRLEAGFPFVGSRSGIRMFVEKANSKYYTQATNTADSPCPHP
jgi:hypothetical protein